MTRLLPAIGELHYNGVTFPGPIRATISSTPTYDEADRSVKYIKHRLRVETFFCHDDTALVQGAPGVEGNDPHVNNVIDHIRFRLSVPGKELRIREKGFGLDVRVNGVATAGRLAGMTWDAEYGPKPRLMAWQPVGDNRTVKVIWEVEFNIPECSGASPQRQNRPLERTYTIDWSIDEAGLTTRTIEGRVEAAINRVPLAGGLKAAMNADDFRNYAQFPIPLGFVRSQRYKLSEDRRTLTFSLIDRELESDFAFTPGTLKMEAKQFVSSKFLDGNAGGFMKWDCSIQAKITLPRNQTMGFGGLPQSANGRRLAWIAFKEILDEKIWRNAKKGSAPGSGILTIPEGENKNSDAELPDISVIKSGNASFLPNSISMREDLYGRSFEFEFTYTIYCSPERIFEASRIMHQNGPGTGNKPIDFGDYLSYVGGRYGSFTGDHGLEEVTTPSRPFDNRGELGTQEPWGREASYFGSNPEYREGVWTEDFIYDYCSPTANPSFNWREPKREKPAKTKPAISGSDPNGDPINADNSEASTWIPKDGSMSNQGEQKCLAFFCNVTHEEIGKTMQHTRMGQTAASSYSLDYVNAADAGDDSGNRYQAVPATNKLIAADRPKIQSLGPPQHLVRVTGYAYQLGYSRTPPSTLHWGEGCTLYRLKKQSTVTQVCKGKLPVYLTTWDMLYNADNSPNGQPLQAALASRGAHTTTLLTNQST